MFGRDWEVNNPLFFRHCCFISIFFFQITGCFIFHIDDTITAMGSESNSSLADSSVFTLTLYFSMVHNDYYWLSIIDTWIVNYGYINCQLLMHESFTTSLQYMECSFITQYHNTNNDIYGRIILDIRYPHCDR